MSTQRGFFLCEVTSPLGTCKSGKIRKKTFFRALLCLEFLRSLWLASNMARQTDLHRGSQA